MKLITGNIINQININYCSHKSSNCKTNITSKYDSKILNSHNTQWLIKRLYKAKGPKEYKMQIKQITNLVAWV